MASSEPDYVTSLILQKPIEMVSPKKIAVLILLTRGWIDKGGYTYSVPRRFETWHRARHRKDDYEYVSWQPRGVPSPAVCLANWRQAGCVKTDPVDGCYVKNTWVLTAKGKALLDTIAPETMKAARAVARATVWAFIVTRRDYERRRAQIAAIAAEAHKKPKRKARKHA